MTQTRLAEVLLSIVLRDVGHETIEVLYPREVFIPIQQIDCDVTFDFADVDGVTHQSAIVHETKDID